MRRKDPTCTKAGMVVATCADCGRRRWVYDETRPALGHDWKDNGDGTATCQREGCGKGHTHTLDEGEVTKKPSCEDTGVKTYHCKEADCNYTKTEDIAATGHTWDDGKITTKASCDHTGVKTYTCKTCGDTRTETIAMLEHTWDEGQVTTKPTCTKKGIRTYTCKVCKATKTEDIEATGHDYKVKDHKDATCTEDGYTTSVCKNCGDEKKETIKATGHQHTEVRGTKKATCIEEGYTGDTYCTDCGNMIFTGKKIEKTDHTWDNGVVSKDPTCTEKGSKTYTCAVCRETKTEEIPATGHQNKEVRDKKAATCTKAGYTGDTCCKDCGELLKTGKETDALGHTWGKGKVTRKSTYTAAGQITYTCSRCGKKRVITTKKLFYPKAGTKYTVAGCQYKVIKAGAEVSLVRTNKNAKSVTIPAVIKVKGVTYKVTSIGTKAFNGSKKLTKVTVGANIKKISNNAFFKCKSLKTVTIKSVLLTKKTANKKAFKGISRKMVIKVPKKMKKVYVKIFKGLKVK
ncbi:leucine-rich repeat domain-containing protein [Anaerobutyricum hallii]|nr:leucine-rich repeat domain-containing protein [Anaerobutyricum hallii]